MQVKQIFKDLADNKSKISNLEKTKADISHIHTASVITFDSSSFVSGNTLYGKADTQAALQAIGSVIDTLTNGGGTITWGGVTGKPFNNLGNQFSAVGGTLSIKDNIFAPINHNHNSEYAPISHSNNNDIHVNSSQKTNIDKIPTLEQSISNLNSLISTSTKQYLVKTIQQRDAIENLNHCDICHVTDERKSYIYEKTDVNGNSTSPEWILFSEFTTVDLAWSNVTDKPFNTIGDGLKSEGNVLKANLDNTTLVISGGKIKVKDNVFASHGHTHTVNWSDIADKPVVYTSNLKSSNFIDSDGLVNATITHNLNSNHVVVKAFGSDKQERFIAIEKVSTNAIKIWTDVKEDLEVVVYPMK